MRAQIHTLSRAIILVLVAVSLGGFFIPLETPAAWVIEILLRGYVMFLCTVMAHEGSHSHLGSTRAANDWWGRLALIPTTVPYVNFRKTHRMHHARTNIPGEDPDYFVKPRHWIEVPLRSLAVPHYWLIWLRRRGWLERRDIVELVIHYLVIGAIFGTIALYVGVGRVVLSGPPALVLVSLCLWYPFAVKTHEGFSLGTPEERSHNYYGRLAYWLSLGLSMHRQHHLRPGLSWIELHRYVERTPGPWWRAFTFRRDVRTNPLPSER